MPVVGIPVDILEARIGQHLDPESLIGHLQRIGCDVEGFATLTRFRCMCCDNILEVTATEDPPLLCDRCGTDFRVRENARTDLGSKDVIRMELLADRPDMFDPGGLARVLRHYLELDVAPAHYQVATASLSVHVDDTLSREQSYRPAIACAVVRNITLDDDMIKVIMKLQENLHWALGRDRKYASIGVYDLSKIRGSQINYRAVDPDQVAFVPLGFDPKDPANTMSLREVLTQHPKGEAYARLLGGFDLYPVLSDSQGDVLSFPPIINSEAMRVSRASTDFFVDVTGLDQRLVEKTLNVVVTSLAEVDPAARLEAVRIITSAEERTTPDLTPHEMTLSVNETAALIGVDLDKEGVIRLLEKMGHAARTQAGMNNAAQASANAASDVLVVQIPAYRNDIMHTVDLVEDVAIAYGYDAIAETLLPVLTVGRETRIEAYSEVARRVLCGLSYFEVLTLILSAEATQYDALDLPRRDDCVRIANPISHEQTIVRTSLVPGLLETFSLNSDQELPQRIFEVGNISCVDSDSESGARERRFLAAAVSGARADYAEVRAGCEALLREFSHPISIQATESIPCFIPGRGARVITERAGKAISLGMIGEVHPQVLERFKLVQPTALFEIDLGEIIAP